eukprot:gene12332-15506_t
MDSPRYKWWSGTRRGRSDDLGQSGANLGYITALTAPPPPIIQCWSGVLPPAGIEPANGTWGPSGSQAYSFPLVLSQIMEHGAPGINANVGQPGAKLGHIAALTAPSPPIT